MTTCRGANGFRVSDGDLADRKDPASQRNALRPAGGTAMNGLLVLAGLAALGLFVYLVYALLKAEEF
jgi:K+-transporting ATPase KdpF subunit